MKLSIRTIQGAAALSALGACATPGIDYTARVAPGNPAAATYRTVAVGTFDGPLAGWYADQFEAMLHNALFDGLPWFEVGLFAGQSNVSGVYEGSVDIGYPDIFERYYSETRCVEFVEEEDEDGDTKKKCVKQVEIEHVCVRYTVGASASPRLYDKQTGELIHAATYYGEDSEEECFETGNVVYRIRRQEGERGRGRYRYAYEDYGRPGYRLGGDRMIDRLTASALLQTVRQARLDIAPYNRDVRATILTEAQDFEVKADPRFATAVQAIRDKQPFAGCAIFAELILAYPSSPSVLHNSGACAEARGDQQAAQGLYAQANEAARLLGIEPTGRMVNALARISGQRADTAVLDRLVPESGVPES